MCPETEGALAAIKMTSPRRQRRRRRLGFWLLRTGNRSLKQREPTHMLTAIPKKKGSWLLSNSVPSQLCPRALLHLFCGANVFCHLSQMVSEKLTASVSWKLDATVQCSLRKQRFHYRVRFLSVIKSSHLLWSPFIKHFQISVRNNTLRLRVGL